MSRQLVSFAQRAIQQRQGLLAQQWTGISNNVAKSFATAATSSGAAAPQLADEENHKQFVEHAVKNFPVEDIKHFEFSVEFLLGTPVPHHQFEQPPILIEVQSRNPEFGHDH